MTLLVKAMQHVQHMHFIIDGLINIAYTIGEGLQAVTICYDGCIALEDVTELRQQVDGACSFVVAEQALKARPDRVHGVRWLHHPGERVSMDTVAYNQERMP